MTAITVESARLKLHRRGLDLETGIAMYVAYILKIYKEPKILQSLSTSVGRRGPCTTRTESS